MSVGKVKDFNFSKTAKDMSAAKCAGYSMGGYMKGGSAKMGQSVQMAKSNAVQKSLVGQKMTKMAKGGATAGKIIEEATGEKYPSRKAMVKHEREETPRMQKEELVQRSMVKGAIPRRQYPVAPAGPMIAPQMARRMAPPAAAPMAAPMPAMKAGGKAMSKAGTAKVGKVMGEFKSGDLHSGAKSGPKVSSRKQAIAIAMSEARNVGKKKK
jgi:hypothetical protein